jgi:hypothetical protein
MQAHMSPWIQHAKFIAVLYTIYLSHEEAHVKCVETDLRKLRQKILITLAWRFFALTQ